MSRFLLKFFLIIYLLLNAGTSQAQALSVPTPTAQRDPRGIWVSCFSDKKVLYSQPAVLELITFCKAAGINEIYLQLYRAGRAYYNSTIADRTKYEEMVQTAGQDTISLLINEAGKEGIKVFAWLNVFSIAENKQAALVVKFGSSVLTKDQYLRPSKRNEGANESDKYYLRDNQLFLEPGDLRVREYILAIINEVLTNYPGINGIHLDYIRYPYIIPALPDSRFNQYGLTYGYAEENVRRFKEKTSLDPLALKDERDHCLRWDNWKREQVTAMVETAAKQIKSKSANLLVSCAVIPSAEFAYSVAFQDWPLWLENGFVDYVVLMNYTRDDRLAGERLTSALAHRGRGKVFAGVGAFLFKDEPQLFIEQCNRINALKADGVVFFSYDDISNKAETIAGVIAP